MESKIAEGVMSYGTSPPKKYPKMNTGMITDEGPNSVLHPNYSLVKDAFTEATNK